jgi:hypothetical protein
METARARHRQMRVERALHGVGRPVAGKIDMGDLAPGMDAGIGAARTPDAYILAAKGGIAVSIASWTEGWPAWRCQPA